MKKCFQTYKTMIFRRLLPLLVLFLLTLTGCTIGNYTPGTFYQMTSRSLSLNDPDLRTCVFDPSYSIVHFPMYHYPPNGHYTTQVYEKVTRSQFQLLHTILDYNRSQWRLFVFDENVITDTYDSQFFQALSSGQLLSSTYNRIDGRVFQMGERLQTVNRLFGRGMPKYYEHLSIVQKDFLFNMGAAFTLYLLGEISKIHKVISRQQFLLVKSFLTNAGGNLDIRRENSYWIFDFREMELRKEVLNFWQRNYAPGTVLLIAYGAGHDFSNEFSGLPFQSGHDFCLKWDKTGSYQFALP